MTSIKNGGYFWLKTNYRVYLCCLEFLSRINYPSFFIGRKRFRGVHLRSPKSLVRRRKSRWRLSRRRCRSSLSRRLSKFQPSRNDQANFLSLKIPLVRLTDVSKVVNRNRRPRKLFVFVFFFLSSFREPSAVLSETMATKPAQIRVYIFWVVHLLAG